VSIEGGEERSVDGQAATQAQESESSAGQEQPSADAANEAREGGDAETEGESAADRATGEHGAAANGAVPSETKAASRTAGEAARLRK